MKKLIFEVSVTVRSPYIFSGMTAAGFGFDTSAIRDENTAPDDRGGLGKALIPGDHLRGHLRHSFKTLMKHTVGVVDEETFANLFGDESEDGSNDEPNRGMAQFSDLVQTGQPKSAGFTRIAIDERTGVVKDGALQVVELAADLNDTTTFLGTLMVFWDEAEANKLEELLNKALRIIPAMGAVKSAGFGEVEHGESSIQFKRALPCFVSAKAGKHGSRVAFDVTFDRPILVDAVRISDNVFAGRKTIPGGAIKGTLARAFTVGGMPSQMNDALAKVVFNHAFLIDSETGKTANHPLPHSMVLQWDKNDVGDVLKNFANGAQLMDDKAVIYQGDWKEGDDKFPRERSSRCASSPREIARTKTAIHHEANTAIDEKLFVTIAHSTKGLTWRFVIEQNGADDDSFAMIVETLKEGLHGLGRTEAFACFKIVDEGPDGPTPLSIDGQEYWPIMLETDAVLSDVACGDGIGDQYKAYFADLGANLRAYFATQHLAGGYVGMRFQAYGSGIYMPFELTDAGSVFLVSVDNRDIIDKLCRTGLPTAKVNGAAVTWKTCPFVAENGYGAISVDGDLHESLKLEVG